MPIPLTFHWTDENHMAKTDIKLMEKYNIPSVRFKKKKNEKNYAPFIVL